MSEEIADKVIARIQEMDEPEAEFEDETLREFAVTIRHLLNRRSRREEVLALASTLFALDEYKKGLKKRLEYARIGGHREREATLLEILDLIEKELEMAVNMKLHQQNDDTDLADEIKRAVLDHLEPTLGRGKWHAREEAAILKTITRTMKGYLVVKI